jgi:hypothetical protein
MRRKLRDELNGIRLHPYKVWFPLPSLEVKDGKMAMPSLGHPHSAETLGIPVARWQQIQLEVIDDVALRHCVLHGLQFVVAAAAEAPSEKVAGACASGVDLWPDRTFSKNICNPRPVR